jgi:1-acyl-sn-glycerol-3-phosphate acyltransferase
MPLLADVQITRKENLPKKGPLIVVGNHTAAMEVVMMTIYTPWIIEFMGSIDIPHDKVIGLIIGLYGFIPVFRGNVTPSSMKTGLDVLNQKGILGIFPEGGIWEPSIRRAQSGVAWLSYHAHAPILPIGFGSMRGALKELFSFNRPTLKMNIGKLRPAVQDHPEKSRKAHFQEESNHIMDAVWELIPAEDRVQEENIVDECFELIVHAQNQAGVLVPVPPEMKIQHGPAFSKFTHRKTLINNFIQNMNMPEVAPLARLVDRPSLEEIITATRVILDHLDHENPYYFTYRYGQQEGQAMGAGVLELHKLALWARENELALDITPVRRYKQLETGQEIEVHRPEEFEKL